jgi:hypothetical protein
VSRTPGRHHWLLSRIGRFGILTFYVLPYDYRY